MDPAVIQQMSKFIVPCLATALFGCALIIATTKRGPEGQVTPGSLTLTLAMGLGCITGNMWANERLAPGTSATDWLGAVAAIGTFVGEFRGEEPRGRRYWLAFAAVGLAVCGWLSVRTLHDWKEAGAAIKVAAPLGMVVVGLVVTLGLARSGEVLKGRGGWPAAAVGWVMAFAASQVIIIGCSVQNAAFTAAGIAAVFGVAGVAGLITRRTMTGPALLAAAGVALSGLVFFGFAQGVGKNGPMALYGGLLTAAAWGPVVMAKVLKEKGRGWVGVLGAAVPALAAVGAAVIISPPWGSGEYE